VGGPLSHLPRGLGGALATIAKLDLTVAGEVDGAAPAFAVASDTGKAGGHSFGWLAAVHLRDEAHAKEALLGGKAPHFKGRGADGGLTVLETPAPGDAAAPHGSAPLMALSPLGYLLVARSEADLVTLAPYATRTLPTRPPPAHAAVLTVPRGALAGALKDRLTAGIADARGVASMLDETLRKEHGGQAPELGDPGAVIQGLDDLAHQKLAVLDSLDHAEVVLDAGEAALTVEASLVPKVGQKPFADLTTGDASPLMTLSADVQGALLVRDDPGALKEGAKTTEDRAMAVFKPALTEKDRAPLHDALTAWAASRGPWLSLAVELEGGPALTVRTPTPDGAQATKAVEKLVALTDIPVFHSLLVSRFSMKGVSVASASAAGGGTTSIATFQRKGPKEETELAVAWAAAGDLLRVALALNSPRALRASRDPERLLGTDAGVAGKLGTLRDRAAVVLMGRTLPGGTDATGGNLVLGVGRDKLNGWAMLEVDDSLAREAALRWLDF
jgi:hypothetical protein